MAKDSLRYVDHQGRIVLPSHIRNTLTLAPGSLVEVTLDDDGTIRIRPTKERCCICGEPVDGKNRAEINAGLEKKLVCFKCSQAIVDYVEKE